MSPYEFFDFFQSEAQNPGGFRSSQRKGSPMSLPAPPYYAVIFTSQLSDDTADYGDVAKRMVELAEQQPGYFGADSARGADGVGITVSYWESEEAIRAWKANAEHMGARALGRERFYAWFTTRVAKVERQYGSD